MSQNRTVIWRLSATRGLRVAPGATSTVGGNGNDAARALEGERLAPHSEQKRCSLGLTCPQAGQPRGSAVPHLPQNFAPSWTAALQLGHCIIADPTRPTADAMSVACHSASRRAKLRLWAPSPP